LKNTISNLNNNLNQNLEKKIVNNKFEKIITYGIIIAIAVSIFLRIYNLEQKNPWFDEIYSWKISNLTFTEIIFKTGQDIHPPLYYFTLKIWMSIFGDSLFAIRMLSVMFGLLSMFFIFKICKIIFNDNLPVLLVLLLYAVSPLNIYYSQEVRMLNMNLFLCLGSVYFFILNLKSYNLRNSIFYCLFSFLSFYTHYFALLIFITQILIIFFEFRSNTIDKNKFKTYLKIFSVPVILYIPWIPYFITQITKGQPWRTSMSFIEILESVYKYFKEIFFSPYVHFEDKFVYWFSTVLTVIIMLVFLIRVIKFYKSDSKNDRVLFYVSLLFLIPLLIALLISMKQSILLSRYLSIIVPYLLIAKVALYFKMKMKYKIYVLILILIISSVYGVLIHNRNDFKNNDYRRITTYIQENDFNPGKDLLIVEPHYMGWMVEYEVKQDNVNLTNPVDFGWNLNQIKDSIKIKSNDNLESFWMILDYSSMEKNDYDNFNNFVDSLGYKSIASKTFYVIPEKVSVTHYVK